MPERSTVHFTYQDYLSIPEDTSHRHEIVEGELFVTPAPRARHSEVVVNLVRVLANHALAHSLGKIFSGPVTVRLHEEGVVEPDVVFVAAGRLGIIDPEGGMDGPPDLVVEVLSPSNRDYDRTIKRKQYMAYGVPELWIVDADERTVEVWRPGEEAPSTVRETLVWSVGGQDFRIPLEEVFRS